MPSTKKQETSLPLVFHWQEPQNPLPLRPVQTRTKKSFSPFSFLSAPWWKTTSCGIPFDFCQSMRRLTEDVVSRCHELHYINPDRLLFAVTQARNTSAYGLQARVTPLRFPGGSLFRKRHNVIYQVQRYINENTEFLYLVTFCLPRFLNQSFDDKMITLFHELFHISPAFDGDLRRHKGRYSLHTHSQKEYDRNMAKLARAYLASKPDSSLFDFLRLSFDQLEKRHGSVLGVFVPRPKIIPINHLQNASKMDEE